MSRASFRKRSFEYEAHNLSSRSRSLLLGAAPVLLLLGGLLLLLLLDDLDVLLDLLDGEHLHLGLAPDHGDLEVLAALLHDLEEGLDRQLDRVLLGRGHVGAVLLLKELADLEIEAMLPNQGLVQNFNFASSLLG